ncbi:MAG: VanZ family protein [Candidatus Omnitrophica bacterium]|nr:VanZ family protein [Candidatus Omnitrophota bacterium]MBU1932959.1 VanZ family protein [Candidatus Omnitrophota bacterium]
MDYTRERAGSSFLKYWIPLYLYAALIFYLSGIPRPLPAIHIPFFDKIMHAGEYSIFGYLAARALKNSPRKTFAENFKALAILFSVLYGISDEFHQSFVSDRMASIFDVAADTVGGTLGAFIYGRYNPV